MSLMARACQRLSAKKHAVRRSVGAVRVVCRLAEGTRFMLKEQGINERIHRVATLANRVAYDSEAARKYAEGAPHVKHAALRSLYDRLVVEIYDVARQHSDCPCVLDLSAGEGSVTLPFLELGAQVTAVDISADQLEML